jgi:tetratricopeptide (TPR) repeat protein
MKVQRTLALALTLLLLLFNTGWSQETSDEPAAAGTPRQQADAEMEKARELLRQGYFDSAVVKYQDAFKIAPDYPAPYEELGRLMMEKKNFAYAIQMYSKLADIEPNNPDYRKLLFSLYDAYDSFKEALVSGEMLIDMGEANPETLKRMSELYGFVDRPLDKARTMMVYAYETDAEADYWNDIAELYLDQSKPYLAEEPAKIATQKDPDNPKYQVTMGQVYAGEDKLGKAEEIFEDLSEASPEDQGLKDELAQIYVQQGDDYLVNGRANTALEYYDLAKETGQADTANMAPDTRGTLFTPDRTFSAPGVGVGDFRRGYTGFAPLGGTLEERQKSAELLMRPQYLFDADFGNSGRNSYSQLNNIVRVPVAGTELDLRVRYAWKDVSSFAGSASRDFAYVGGNYNWNKEWSTQAYLGTSGLYDMTTLYEGDRVRGGFLVQRDIYGFTPRALGNDLKFNRQGLFGGVSLGDRLSLDGGVDFYQYDDDIDSTVYYIGPSYQLIFEPGVQELLLSYVYSGETNTRTLDPIVRFSPRALNVHSIGLDYSRLVTDWWRFRVGYFQGFSNVDGGSGGTWNLGSDFQLWKGAFLGLEYQRGNFANGVIGPNLQNIREKNDNLNVNFGMSF